ncbi:RseA family anti-sigma factor [Pseudoxanthomonas putridarboris]|uniref:RseA family anti-sigma factor n=1 Tax=Pseudoxanthomonas putridarboris TaxID=752605 RepID=A0ABU9J3D1_9GAMM
MTARNDSFATDKLDLHYRQQLSALMDGGLAADEARFLMRRLQHDRELTGCWERWQLCGDVLRGQATAPAPAGFAERVARIVALEAPLAGEPASSEARRNRTLLTRWGGGALAASVALVALFMARQQAPQDAPAEGPMVASQQATASPAPASPDIPAPEPAAPDAEAYAAVAAVAVASVPRRQDNAARRSATRNQQAARAAARVAQAEAPPVRALAASPATALAPPPLAVPANPFSSPRETVPQARPWPRSTLSGYPSAGGLTTGYANDSAERTFYPFEPRLPATPPVAPPQD